MMTESRYRRIAAGGSSRWAPLVACAALLSGCFDGGGDPPGTEVENTPPVAVAGADQSVFALSSVSLNGGGSSDADGDIIRYTWELTTRPAGSAAALSSTNTATTSFTPDRPGSYVATLTAADGFAGSSSTDTVTITANTPAPVANAGPDQSQQFSEPGITIQLTAAGSSDPLGLPLSYTWVISNFVPASGVPPVTPAALVGASTVNPTLPLTDTDQAGTYTLQVTASNGSASGNDTVVVSVASLPPPVANAGPDQQVVFPVGGSTVQLDGTGSSDPSSLPLTYDWEIVSFQPDSGTTPVMPVTLVGANTATPSFDVNDPDQLGTYTIRLTVDNGSLPASDTVQIEVAKSFPASLGLLWSALASALGALSRRRLAAWFGQARAALSRLVRK
jgi:hypothetical protein